VARSRSLRPVAASVRETAWETRRAGPRAGVLHESLRTSPASPGQRPACRRP